MDFATCDYFRHEITKIHCTEIYARRYTPHPDHRVGTFVDCLIWFVRPSNSDPGPKSAGRQKRRGGEILVDDDVTDCDLSSTRPGTPPVKFFARPANPLHFLVQICEQVFSTASQARRVYNDEVDTGISVVPVPPSGKRSPPLPLARYRAATYGERMRGYACSWHVRWKRGYACVIAARIRRV